MSWLVVVALLQVADTGNMTAQKSARPNQGARDTPRVFEKRALTGGGESLPQEVQYALARVEAIKRGENLRFLDDPTRRYASMDDFYADFDGFISG